MTDAEKKAIKWFYNLRGSIDESNMLFDEDIEVKCGKETIEQITTVLNLIQKQQEEIKFQKDINKMEKKRYKQTKKSLKGQIIKANKIIDLIAETLRYYNGVRQEQEFCIDICGKKECNIKKCANRIKQYFEREVENGR
jgi:hypothetical protein